MSLGKHWVPSGQDISRSRRLLPPSKGGLLRPSTPDRQEDANGGPLPFWSNVCRLHQMNFSANCNCRLSAAVCPIEPNTLPNAPLSMAVGTGRRVTGSKFG